VLPRKARKTYEANASGPGGHAWSVCCHMHGPSTSANSSATNAVSIPCAPHPHKPQRRLRWGRPQAAGLFLSLSLSRSLRTCQRNDAWGGSAVTAATAAAVSLAAFPLPPLGLGGALDASTNRRSSAASCFRNASMLPNTLDPRQSVLSGLWGGFL
jgi:hypothetical protein